MMSNQSIEKTLASLKKARKNLQEIRERFSDNSTLLKVYEPSAKALVRFYQEQLEEDLVNQTEMDISVRDKTDMDFWIHIEGDEFQNGNGPITFVSKYLNKLNKACKDTIRLFGQQVPIGREDSLFYLAGIAAGSLRIGIKKNSSFVVQNAREESLFAEDEMWADIKNLAKKNNNIERAMVRLLETMESANSEDRLDEIRKRIGDDYKFLKLLNYARDLAPSNKSGVSGISFESGGKDFHVSQDTRMLISNYSQKMLPEKEYVSGIAAIRSQDMDSRKIIARPFRYEDKTINELECIVPDEINGMVYLDQIVGVTGFLIKSGNYGHPKLEIDTIVPQPQDD